MQPENRVLHVFRIMNRGGAETATMNIYRNLDRDKIQFDFICMDTEEGEFDNEIYSLGGKIYRINPPSLHYIKHIKSIIKICKEREYAAIQIPTQFHSGVVCLAAYLAKIPVRIVYSHSAGDVSKNVIRKVYNHICRLLINLFSTDKLACGELAGKFLFGKKCKNFKILHNGIDLKNYYSISKEEKEKVKKEFKIEDDDFVIGHVGSFKKLKNQVFFINIAKELIKEKKKFKIILVGDGEDRKSIGNIIKEEGLENYFILPGIREDIPKIMSIFNVFVMPSLYEGFPMVIIEALATLKNCVVSNNISQEVNIDNKSVAFLNLNDPVEKWIDVIYKQSKRNINKEERIKILIEKGFDIKSTINELEKIYLR